MYAFKTILALAVPFMVVANPLVARTDPPTTCNSGSAQCCQNIQQASDAKGLSGLLGLLGLDVVVGDILGLNCSPIDVLGPGMKCGTDILCCTNVQFEGLINLGCTPIDITL